MEHWKRTIERANRCFMAGELVDAREAYLQALALAQVLFERWADADEAVAACVISHHNLADLHLRLNQPEESAEYLCAIHQRLLQTMQDPRLSPPLRAAPLRPTSPTRSPGLTVTDAPSSKTLAPRRRVTFFRVIMRNV